MMLTRCPHCATAFRVTPEQLRVREGQVRCGHCHGVFNALSYLEEEAPLPTRPVQPREPIAPAVMPLPVFEPERWEPRLELDSELVAEATVESIQVEADALPEDWVETVPTEAPVDEVAVLNPDFLETPEQNTIQPLDLPEPFEIEPTKPEDAPAAEAEGEMAQDVASESRHIRDYRIPVLETYEGEEGLTGWSGFSGGAPRWLFGAAISFLLLLFAAQALYQYRTSLASNFSAFSALYKVLGIRVPLPRITEQVSIEASDLRAAATRGQLILTATLKNRANFAQDWPALELTLTDAQEAVLSRRVLYPSDYLPSEAPPVLMARGEMAVNLGLSASKLNAAGYRLYVFYP